MGDSPALVQEDLFREVTRESVRVVELEQEAAVDSPWRRDLGTLRRRGKFSTLNFDVVLDSREAGLQRVREPFFLVADGVLDASTHRNELGVGVRHELRHPRHRLPEERLREPEHPAVAHRAAHDAA